MLVAGDFMSMCCELQPTEEDGEHALKTKLEILKTLHVTKPSTETVNLNIPPAWNRKPSCSYHFRPHLRVSLSLRFGHSRAERLGRCMDLQFDQVPC